MSYAGFQRYEVPDIGTNVAKILMTKQEQQANRDAKQQALDLQNRKLQNANEKEQRKLQQSVEGEIDRNETLLNKTISDTPKTGYTTFDGMITGSVAPQILSLSKQNNDMYRTNPMESPKYKTTKQSLQNAGTTINNTAKNIQSAYTKSQTAKNASPSASWLMGTIVKQVTSSPENPTNIDMKLMPNGEIKFVSQRFNANNELQSEIPFESLDAISAIQDFEALDLDARANTMAGAVGKKAVEIKSGGGTKTDIDLAIQDNWKSTKQAYVNSVKANPRDATDAYIALCNDPSKNSVMILEGTSDAEKRKNATANGYPEDAPLSEINFIEFKINENGFYIPKLNEKQNKELEVALGKTFDNKADRIVTLSTPSSTNNVFNLQPNVERETVPTRAELVLKGSIPSIKTGLANAQSSGRIANTGDKKPRIIYDTNGNPIKIRYYKNIGKNPYIDNMPLFDKEATELDLTNPKDQEFFRIEFGEISDASKDRADQRATYPEKK